jgi:hypothetical protein
MTSLRVGFVIVLASTLACSGGGESSQSQKRTADTTRAKTSQQESSRICGGADSLVFSNLVSDSETKDVSGTEIVLARRGAIWVGSSREAAGEFLGRVPLLAVNGDTVPGPISFSMPDEKDTAVFRGAIYCDSLAGEMRDFRNTPFEPVTFKRIRP